MKTKIIFSLIVITIFIWGVKTLFNEDIYIGFYYPDASNLFNDIQSDTSFGSLDECRVWMNKKRSIYNPDGTKQDDYECGKNCSLQNGQKPYICEETLE